MTIQELAGLCNLKLVDDTAVGVYKSYPIALCITNGDGRDTLSLNFQLDKAIGARVIKHIRKGLPKGAKIASAAAGILSVICICDYSDGGSNMNAFNLARQMLDVSLEAFQIPKKPLKPRQRCSCCGKPNCDSAALIGATYQPVHRGCVVNKSQKDADRAQKNEESGNYFLGFLGAFLGALIGCIPNILLILFLQIEYGLLYIAIPFASFIGYKLFRGKRGGVGRVIVILCSLLSFIISQPTYYFISFQIEGYAVSFFEIFSLYFTNMTIIDILADTWFGILFLCIGIFTGAKTIGTTNYDAIKAANVSIDSIMSLHGGYDSVQYAADTYADNKTGGKEN